MHISTQREALIQVLTRVCGVVEKRQTVPILGNVHIHAEADMVTFSGSDTEVEIRTRFAASVTEAGAVTVPARKFFDICKAVPEHAEISFQTQRRRATIIAGKSHFNLSTLPADDYPFMATDGAVQTIEVEPSILKELFAKTAFAMANQDVRYYLNGLFFRVHERGITAVATDGHRLAMHEQWLALPIEEPIQVIIPGKAVHELGRLLAAGGNLVRLDLSPRTLRVVMGETVMTLKLVDGRFPDYERVIPLDADKVAVIERDTWRQSLLRIAILSDEKFKGIRMGFDLNELTLQAQNTQQDEAEETIEMAYRDEPVVIGFNVGYLLDVFSVVDEPQVEVRFTGSHGSILLRGVGRESPTYVVMPMLL